MSGFILPLPSIVTFPRLEKEAIWSEEFVAPTLYEAS